MSREDVLPRLIELIGERQRLRPSNSYVVSLLDGGVDAIGAKVREEAEELIEAAAANDPDHSAREAADLLFHVCVLLTHAGVSFEAVLSILESRFGTSGLEEKASRGNTEGGGEC
jgi:phosphoribosyl-ATP pyrophosphohydrolase